MRKTVTDSKERLRGLDTPESVANSIFLLWHGSFVEVLSNHLT